MDFLNKSSFLEDSKIGSLSSLDEKQIKKIIHYLKNLEHGFVFVEVNEPVRQDKIISLIKKEVSNKKIITVDLKNTKLNHYEEIEDQSNKYNPDIIFIINFHLISKLSRNIFQSEIIRDLNFSREIYNKLKKTIVFFLPTYFIDLIIKSAPDFYDFVSIVFKFPTENESLIDKFPSFEDEINTRFLKNRATFLESVLEEKNIEPNEYIDSLMNLSNIYLELKMYKESKTKSNDGLKFIKDSNDIKTKIFLLTNLANADMSLKNYDQALAYLYDALKYYNENNIDDKNTHVGIYFALSKVYFLLTDYNKSLKFINKALDIEIVNANRDNLYSIYIQISQVYNKLGNYEKSLDVLNKNLSLYPTDTDDLYQIVEIYLSISNTYFLMKNYKETVNYLNKSLICSKKENNILHIGTTLLNFSNVFIEQKKYDQAIEYINQCLDLKLNDSKINSFCIYSLAEIYQKKGDYKLALDTLKDIVNEPPNLHNYGALIQINFLFANIYFDLGEFDKSLNYRKNNLLIIEKFKDEKLKAWIIFNIGNYYFLLGDFDKSNSYYMKVLKIYKKINDLKGKINIFSKIALNYFRKKDFNKSIIYLRESLELINTMSPKDIKTLIVFLRNIVSCHIYLNNIKKAINYQKRVVDLIKENNLLDMNEEFILLKQLEDKRNHRKININDIKY